MATEIGSTGLDQWGGTIRDDFLRELRGADAYKRYDEMRKNSPIIGALLLAIELSIRGSTWNFVSDQGESDPRVELLTLARDNMRLGWNDHISEVLTMLPFGWSYFETVYERVGGDVLWRKFAVRGQDTLDHWELDERGEILGMWQRAAPKYIPVLLPIEKCILYRTRVERNNPEGRSLLRNAWIPYYYWKNISQIEAIGIERDLAGLPKITLPESADTDESSATSDYTKASKLVRRVRNDQQAGLVIPFGWEFELVSTGGSRQFDTDKVIGRYESRMLMSVLAQFLMLGQDKVGTQALSQDQTDFFAMAVNAIADIISETFTKHAVPQLLALNGYDADGITLEHTPSGDIDITILADFLAKVGSYITWTTQDEVWLRSVARLPEVDETELEAEREKKAETQAAMLEKVRQSTQGQEPKKDEDKDKQDDMEPDDMMGATKYAAGNAPDDAERRKWERRLKALYKQYFDAEKKRLITAAKALKNG